MSSMFYKTVAGSLLLTWVVAGSLSAANRENAEERRERLREAREELRERDDASARARWMEQWYNEGRRPASDKTEGGGRYRSLWSQSYQRFMMEAAKRERIRYAAKMPVSGASAMVIDPAAPIRAKAADSASRDLRWTNIGPTKANFARNGVTLNVTDSGRINAIATNPSNPSTIYIAVSGGGLWKSTDGGAFWQAKTETLGTLSIGTVEMDPNDPNVLYLGLGDFSDGTGLGVVKMTGGGDYWEEPVLLGDSSSVRDIEVAPANSNIVIVATNNGIYRSTDAGKSYALVPLSGLSGSPSVWTIAYAGGNSFVVSLEGTPTGGSSTEGQIWRSTDNGASWTKGTGVTHANGVHRISLASAPSNRSVIYAMASKTPTDSSTRPDLDLASIYKSTDGGQNWVDVGRLGDGSYKAYTNPNDDQLNLEDLLNGQGWYNHAIVVSPTNPNVAYFGGALLSVKTSDGGGSFSVLTDWLGDFGMPYVHADFHAAHIASNGTLYFGTDGGLFMSSNGGASFTATLNEGIVSHLVYHACSTPANPNFVIAGLQDNGTRQRESNTSVFNQTIGGDGFGCFVSPTNANLMLGSLYYERIQKSSDGGNTYAQSCTGIAECGKKDGTATFHTVIKDWAGDATGNTVYTYSAKVVYRSTNFAGSWTALGSTGLPTDLFIRGLAVAKTSGTSPNNDNVVGIVANSGRVYLTADGGTSWTRAANPGNNGLSMSSIAFDPVDRNIVYVTSVAADASRTHVWRSTNFGTSWAAIDGNGFPAGIPVNSITVDPVVRTTLYAATHLGVYRSLDSGTNWERLGSFLPLVNVTDIALSADGNQVRAATFGRGIWELGTIGANVAPTANFTVNKSNMTANFTDTSTDSDGSISRRQWNFGDGVSSLLTNPQHTYATPGTYTVTLTVTDNNGYTNTKTAQVAVPAASTRKVHNDFNGDGKSDVVLWNASLGYVGYWIMNGSIYTGANGFNLASGYAPASTGFLSPIPQASLLARDTGTQTLSSYIWNGSTHAQGIIGGAPAGWDAIGQGDINGDGKDDLMWRNPSTGQFAYWLMDGAVYLGGNTYGPPATYVVAGIADFNGDGKVDLLWNDPGTHNASIWTSTGNGFSVALIGQYGTDWNMVGTADVTGDGRADILLRDSGNVYLAYWKMDGAVYQGSSAFGLASDRALFTTGDFDGDGIEDVVIQRGSDRTLWLWRSNGSVFTESNIGQYGTGWAALR